MENSKKLLNRKAFFKLFKNANQFEIHQINSKDKDSMRVDVTAYYDSSIIDIPPDITLKQLAVIVINGFQRVEERLDNLEKDVTDIKVRIDKIETRLSNIENCPTIQKELGMLKK